MTKELRDANKKLLDCLKKSQEDIAKLIVSAKHSDHRLMPTPLTSTLAQQHNRNSTVRRNKVVTFQQENDQSSRSRRKRDATSSPKPSGRGSCAGGSLRSSQRKSPVTSRFLRSRLADADAEQSTIGTSLLDSPGNNRPAPASCIEKSAVVSLTTKADSDPVQTTLKTPDHLEEIREFRKRNRMECHSSRHWSELMKTPKTPKEESSSGDFLKMHQKTPDPSDTRDPRIINFTVNERIFPVPVDPNENIDPGTHSSPRYIRVSIPKSTLMTPHKYEASKRGEGSSGFDSLALPDHCAKGWQHTVPRRMDRDSSVQGLDLRSWLRPKENLASLQLKSGQACIPVRNDVKDRSFLYNTTSFEAF